jgi:hypothetical protein
VLKRSIDAVNNKINLKVAVYFKGNLFKMKKIQIQNILMLAMHKKLLLGAGPAGLLPLCS